MRQEFVSQAMGWTSGLIVPTELKIRSTTIATLTTRSMGTLEETHWYNTPPIFSGLPQDIRLWIMELNVFSNLPAFKGFIKKEATTYTYHKPKVRTRTQVTRLAGQRIIFQDKDTL